MQILPIFNSTIFRDIKDPCPVFDGTCWHIYGSAGDNRSESWSILHLKADNPEGPWKELPPAVLCGLNQERMAAPGVIFDFTDRTFHMFIQTDFMALNSSIEHFVSADGHTFTHLGTALQSVSGSAEGGVYDGHPALLHGEKYLAYSAMAVIGRPDIYVAKSASGTWNGPWERKGQILNHSQVAFHNPLNDPGYEWGLEGAQLIGLPNGNTLLLGVCFLKEAIPGRKQRVFTALSTRAEGPYEVQGVLVDPAMHAWAQGENGHAAAIICNEELLIYFQVRHAHPEGLINNWQYALVKLDVNSLKPL